MDGEGASLPGPAALRGGRVLWWAFRIAVLVLAAVALVLLGGELPDPGRIWAVALGAEPGWLAVLVVAAAMSMGAFARLQRRLLRTGGLAISLRRVSAVTYASNALSTTLPAGAAVSVIYTFQQFRRSGASAQLATAVIVLGGVVTTAAYGLVALLALLAEPRSRVPAMVGLAMLAAVAASIWLLRDVSARLAARVKRACLARPRVAQHVERLRELMRNGGLLRLSARDWGVLSCLALLNWLLDILALVAAVRAVGLEVSPYGVALAYFAAQAAGSLLPVLPGGLGAIESAMAGALVALGAGLVPAGAAVALYRLVSFWGVVAVGWLAWLALRRNTWRLPVRTETRAPARPTERT